MTTLETATNVDRLAASLIEEAQTQQINTELLNEVKAVIAITDFDSDLDIEQAQANIVSLIPETLALTVDDSNVNAIDLVDGFAGGLVADRTNANRLRLASRRCLQDMAVYLDTLPVDAAKTIAASIGRSQKHIISTLTPTSGMPAWVWLDGNEVKSYRIGFSAAKKGIVCAERKEKALQVDILGALRAEKQAHALLSACITDETDGEVWLTAVDLAIQAAMATKTTNVSILNKIDELKPRIEAANWRSYRMLTLDGFKGFSQQKLETAETLLKKSGSGEDRNAAKAELIKATAAYHQSEHARKERLEYNQKQAQGILERLQVADVYEALADYDQIKPKYGAALDKIDALSDELIAAYTLIDELKAALSKPAKTKKVING